MKPLKEWKNLEFHELTLRVYLEPPQTTVNFNKNIMDYYLDLKVLVVSWKLILINSEVLELSLNTKTKWIVLSEITVSQLQLLTELSMYPSIKIELLKSQFQMLELNI